MTKIFVCQIYFSKYVDFLRTNKNIYKGADMKDNKLKLIYNSRLVNINISINGEMIKLQLAKYFKNFSLKNNQNEIFFGFIIHFFILLLKYIWK